MLQGEGGSENAGARHHMPHPNGGGRSRCEQCDQQENKEQDGRHTSGTAVLERIRHGRHKKDSDLRAVRLCIDLQEIAFMF